MKRIFISTEKDKPVNCFDEPITIANYLIQNNFPVQPVKEVTNNVYLILDTLTQLPDTIAIDQQTDLLLFHETTTNNIKNLFPYKKEGHHMQAEKYYYRPVFDILLSNCENKAEKILKVLGYADEQINEENKLKYKLQLLHEIYEGKDTSEISADKSLEEFSKKITDFKATVTKYNNEDNNHRAALIELRDALLADV